MVIAIIFIAFWVVLFLPVLLLPFLPTVDVSYVPVVPAPCEFVRPATTPLPTGQQEQAA